MQWWGGLFSYVAPPEHQLASRFGAFDGFYYSPCGLRPANALSFSTWQMVPSFLCCLAGLHLSIKAEAKSLQAMAHVRIARGPLLLPELLQLSSQLEVCMARVCDMYR